MALWLPKYNIALENNKKGGDRINGQRLRTSSRTVGTEAYEDSH